MFGSIAWPLIFAGAIIISDFVLSLLNRIKRMAYIGGGIALIGGCLIICGHGGS